MSKKEKLHTKVRKQRDLLSFPMYVLKLLTAFAIEFLVVVATLCIILIAIAGCGFIGYKIMAEPRLRVYQLEAKQLVASKDDSIYQLNEKSTIYDVNGTKIAELYRDAPLVYLEYKDIPKDVINAFVAVEDRTFWDNPGYDLQGIARVVYRAYITKGDELHGASTITQQLARAKYLTTEVSMERKLKEIYVASELTKKYSKRKIMEYYVNNVCFANGIYGIEGAANAYFGKTASELSLSEIAYLCAIPNRPEYFNPLKNVNNAVERRNKILADMCECGYIDYKAYSKAKHERVKLNPDEKLFNNFETTYVVDCVVRHLMKQEGFQMRYAFQDMDDYNNYKAYYNEIYEKVKDVVYTNGYEIHTSLDLEKCKQLQEILDEQLSFNDEMNEVTNEFALQGAITCVDNLTGKVVALTGGRTSENNSVYSLNRAYQSYRQPGSSIKPLIVYTPQIERGYTPETSVQNISIDAAKADGANVQALTGTAMTLRSAVENSKNGVAWQLFDQLTPRVGLSYLEHMNYSSVCPNDYFDPSALGGFTYGVTTVEQAGAYSALVNHGRWIEPTCITSIKNKQGHEIYKPESRIKVYKAEAADIMVDILKGVPIRGTAAKLKWYNSSEIEVMCKTGTTNKSKDGWLCGSSPYYSIAVWVGFDQPKELSNLYGATYPGEIWKASMLAMTDGYEKAEFKKADRYEPEDVCAIEDKYEEYEEEEEVTGVFIPANQDDLYVQGVSTVCSQILAVDKEQPDWQVTLQSLFNQASVMIGNIENQDVATQLRINLNNAYVSVVNR